MDPANWLPAGYRHPWVYTGPGIWISDPDGKPRRVHIRLSHTTNNVSGLQDYTGQTDPRRLRLAISPKSMVTLRIRQSSWLRFEGIGIRFGGQETAYITDSRDIVFDHVRSRRRATGPTGRTTTTG